jgi:hypothetical protein
LVLRLAVDLINIGLENPSIGSLAAGSRSQRRRFRPSRV